MTRTTHRTPLLPAARAHRRMRAGVVALGFVWAAVTDASAHGGADVPASWWRAGDVDAGRVALLVFFGALYALGIRRLRTAAGAAKLQRAVICFAAGWATLAIALVSPIHPLSRLLFSIHMTQHELLMVVAAPLVVLGRPAIALLWALPRPHAAALIRGGRRIGLGVVWDWSTNVFIASLVHAIALWIWHLPALFEATLRSDAVHALQHGAFFGAAVVFWQAILFGPRRSADYGLAVLYLFLTAMHSGALGALITFGTTVWYPSYQHTDPVWGLTAMEDQQLGGLIMWVPAGVIYVVAGLILFAAWLRDSDRRRRTAPSPPTPSPTCA